MGKVITVILIILGLIWLGGGCEDCGDCGCDCSGGCDLGCGSCFDCSEKIYNGKITLKIHTWDNQVITVKGHRDSNKSGSIFTYGSDYTTYGSYQISERVGYRFSGLYYRYNTSLRYIMSQFGVNFEQIRRIEDDQEIDVYESWEKINYTVKYVTNDYTINGSNSTYNLQYYTIDSSIEMLPSIQSVFNSELNDRKHNTGYTAYYVDAYNNIQEFDWTFGTFNESIILKYDNINETADQTIYVKQNWVSDKVKVELNYNYPSLSAEEIIVDYDADLTPYFTNKVTDETIEFFGWYLDQGFAHKVPAEISKQYENTPLKLYAKFMQFKTIFIDFQDGKAPITARVYEDGTFSINTDKAGYVFYGLTDNPDIPRRIYYAGLTSGNTYYAVYVVDENK